jgi:hypothetical protein
MPARNALTSLRRITTTCCERLGPASARSSPNSIQTGLPCEVALGERGDEGNLDEQANNSLRRRQACERVAQRHTRRKESSSMEAGNTEYQGFVPGQMGYWVQSARAVRVTSSTQTMACAPQAMGAPQESKAVRAAQPSACSYSRAVGHIPCTAASGPCSSSGKRADYSAPSPVRWP